MLAVVVAGAAGVAAAFAVVGSFQPVMYVAFKRRSSDSLEDNHVDSLVAFVPCVFASIYCWAVSHNRVRCESPWE